LEQSKTTKKHLDGTHGCDEAVPNLFEIIQCKDGHEVHNDINSNDSQDVGTGLVQRKEGEKADLDVQQRNKKCVTYK